MTMLATARATGAAPATDRPARRPAPASLYRALLTWAFTLLNGVRVLSYLPTLWAIHASGDSSQHSLLTWGTWFGANLTMALWLRENNGGRIDRAALVNLGNAAMCGATLALIAWYRL